MDMPAPAQIDTATRETQVTRLGALSGIALTVVAFGTWTVEGPDNSTASTEQVRRFYVDNQTELQVYAVLSMLSVAVLLVFVTQLRVLVRQAEGPHGLLADLVYAGGLLTAVGTWVSAALGGFSYLADDINAVDSSVLRGWYSLGELDEYFGDLATVPRGILITAVSVAALRYAILPRWTAWVGLVIGVSSLVCLVPWVGVAPLFFLGLFGFYLWPAAVGIVLTRRAYRHRAGATGDSTREETG